MRNEYKEALFSNKSDQEIENWIIEQLGKDEDPFVFGKYTSFINLNKESTKGISACFIPTQRS